MFIAYIQCYRGTGRPDRIVVREGNGAQDVDPMSAHNGVCFIGVFDTREAANTAADRYWGANVATDRDGYVQWR